MMRFLCAFLIITGLLATAPAVQAQGIIRDAESEAFVKQIGGRIFTAAGLNPSQIRIVIIGDDTINAFVAGGQNLFLYTGLLLETKKVSELGGVIAHEAGHMAGGHLIRLRDQMERMSVESIVSTLAGVAIGVGAGNADAGIGIAAGGGELARRRMLQHSRVFESSADQAGMRTLDVLGYSAQGMADFLEHLSAQEALPELQRSGYILTHPLSRERLDTVKAFVTRSRNSNHKWPQEWQDKFLRVQAKILAFTQPQHAETVFTGKKDFASRYGFAIAQYRQGRIAPALAGLEALEKEKPADAYITEMRGQILFEQGRIPEAKKAYRDALAKAPNEVLIRLGLVQSLLQDEKADTSEALKHLLYARDHGERDTPLIYRYLAIAYGRNNQPGMAQLALAEEALLKRDLGTAVQRATSAGKLIPSSDAPARQRANDILQAANQLKNNKK